MDFFSSDEPWGVPLSTVLLMMPFLLGEIPSRNTIVCIMLTLMYPGPGGYTRDGSETNLVREAGATDIVDYLLTFSSHSLTIILGTDYEIVCRVAEASSKWWALPYHASTDFLGGDNICSDFMDYDVLSAFYAGRNLQGGGRPRSTGTALHDVACMYRWLRRSAPGTGVEVGDFQYSQSTVWVVIRHTSWAMTHGLNDMGAYEWPTPQQALADWLAMPQSVIDQFQAIHPGMVLFAVIDGA